MSNFGLLLAKAHGIIRMHEQLAKKQGTMFNVFEILGRATDEEKGHSAFIASLLDPLGSHCQGTMFLDLFLNQVRRLPLRANLAIFPKAIQADNTREMRVFTERSFSLPGESHNDWGDTGRIDIVIEGERTILIIENKIYAEDQSRQLARYHKYAEDSSKSHVFLFYLTLDGAEPSDDSLGELKGKDLVIPIGYDTFIETWIKECTKAALSLPYIRETLQQYRNLVRVLTGRGTSEEMNMDLKNLLLEGDNLETAINMQDAVNEAISEIKLRFWNRLDEILENKFGSKAPIFRHYAKCDDDRAIVASSDHLYEGISYPFYRLKNGRKNGRKIVFFVELASKTSYGFRLYSDDDKWQELTKEDKQSELVHLIRKTDSDFKPSKWSLGWKYTRDQLPLGEFDARCARLARDDEMEKYMNGIEEEINACVDTFKKVFDSYSG